MNAMINRVIDTVERISNHSVTTQVCIAFTTILSNFFLPIVPVILTCFGLTLVDLFYGLAVAKKAGRIDSRRTWDGTLTKLKDTFTILALIRGIELYLLGEVTGTVLVGAAATIIAVTELWSILENMNTLNPKGPWRALGKYMKIKGSEVIGVDIEKLQK